MNQLPPEMICKILDYLNVQNKFKCKLIDRRFNSIIKKHLKIKRLTVLGIKSNDFDKNWFFTNRPNDENDLICLKEDYLGDHLTESVFLKLKQLFISLDCRSNDELIFKNSINQLNYLEELNIYSANIQTACSLDLPNLRILFLGMKVNSKEPNEFPKIKLNTPNLSNFKCVQNINCYQFIYPTKLKYLYLNYDDGDENIEPDNEQATSLEQFVDLEYLFCTNYSTITTDVLLNKLNKLKEIHIFKATRQHRFDGLYVFETIFDQLQKQQRSKHFSTNNLKLYVSGIDYRKYRKLKEQFNDQTNFCLENYSNLIDCLPFINEISYDDLIRIFKTQIPVNLFTKFPNIKEITCNHVISDLDLFFNFLKNCKNLGSLSLNCVQSFSNQQDFDKINESCPTLIFLSIAFHKSVYVNLDFIFKFKFLNGLVLNKQLTYDFIESLFIKLKRFRFLHFIYRGKVGDLTYDRFSDLVHLCQNSNFLMFENLNDFLNFLK